MAIPSFLFLFISLLIGFAGIIFLLFPNHVHKLEEKLNTPWGNRNVMAIRIGLQGEQAAERILNHNVMEKRITWDGWVRSRPRFTGLLLCLASLANWWLTLPSL